MVATAYNFDNVEATPLESLPGHMDILELPKSITNIKEKKYNNCIQQHEGLFNLKITIIRTKIIVTVIQ